MGRSIYEWIQANKYIVHEGFGSVIYFMFQNIDVKIPTEKNCFTHR